MEGFCINIRGYCYKKRRRVLTVDFVSGQLKNQQGTKKFLPGKILQEKKILEGNFELGKKLVRTME